MLLELFQCASERIFMGKVSVTLSPVCHVLDIVYIDPAAGEADIVPDEIDALFSHVGILKLIGKESDFDTVILNPTVPSNGYSG